jgi:hypothetical protein
VETGVDRSRPLREGDKLYINDNCLEIFKIKVAKNMTTFDLKVKKQGEK